MLKMLIPVVLVFLCFSAPKPVLTWQKAVLQEVSHGDADTKFGKARAVRVFTLDAGDRIIVCAYEASMHLLDVPVGATLDYARPSNSRIIIRDPNGKEHKLLVQRETMKVP